MREEVITLIENSIGRSVEDIKNNENESLYSQGINSFEMVQIVVEIEEKYGISLDNLLTRLNRVSLSELCDEIERLVSVS
ncbi:MAG: acyl carrier protein [Clostridia bacterium]|nr:acyl carrier protein [Clostridia bacterium]